MGRLDGKIAIITGGAGGIGSATCRKFVEEGARVVIADINMDTANDLANDIGEGATPAFYDATDPASVESVVRSTVEREGRLNVLHNNHAVTDTMPFDNNAVDIDLDVWERVMKTNLRGYLLGCRFAIPHLLATGGGSIVNTASIGALTGGLGRIAYCTSKGGIVSLTRMVATEYGRRGLRCNAIAPGLIVTPALERVDAAIIAPTLRHTVLPRAGRPEDIANLACFLASEESSFITGQIITVDGGLLIKSPSFADEIEA
jgi:NAD(P)-dependent dehydrogenase (short-subunit alcohol dehydrogenase family)